MLIVVQTRKTMDDAAIDRLVTGRREIQGRLRSVGLEALSTVLKILH